VVLGQLAHRRELAARRPVAADDLQREATLDGGGDGAADGGRDGS
jgi:hypothetical protein